RGARRQAARAGRPRGAGACSLRGSGDALSRRLGRNLLSRACRGPGHGGAGGGAAARFGRRASRRWRDRPCRARRRRVRRRRGRRAVAALASCGSRPPARGELGRGCRPVRGADAMALKLLQAIAGAPHGGAETFFVRLAGAFKRDGDDQRVLIRRDPARAKELRSAGVEVVETGFGGRLDLATRLIFRRQVASFRPDIVLTWMRRATRFCPRGKYVHLARLGGYYDLKYFGHCDHLIGNTRTIVDYAVKHGWSRNRVHYLPNFVPDPGPRRRPERDGNIRVVAL